MVGKDAELTDQAVRSGICYEPEFYERLAERNQWPVWKMKSNNVSEGGATSLELVPLSQIRWFRLKSEMLHRIVDVPIFQSLYCQVDSV